MMAYLVALLGNSFSEELAKLTEANYPNFQGPLRFEVFCCAAFKIKWHGRVESSNEQCCSFGTRQEHAACVNAVQM